jgi:hypothetical protein
MLELGLAVLACREDIAQVRSVAQSVRPKGCADGLGPLLSCVQELLASALREVVDGLLSNAILEVRIYPAKGELLALGLACLTEEAVGKSTVVTVVVGNTDAMLSGKLFEGALRIDGFLAGEIAGHHVDKLETGIKVHKNGGIPIARLGECPLQLAIKTRLS